MTTFQTSFMTTPEALPFVPAMPDEVTPVEHVAALWLKRDDKYTRAGIAGGKVRTCEALVQRAIKEGYPAVVTAGSRQSPQVSIVARLAEACGLAMHAFIPWSKQPDSPEVTDAIAHGATIHEVRPGHNSVIIARAREYANANNYYTIPFGMEDWEAVRQTGSQYVATVADALTAYGHLPWRRLVVPVGSGMSLAGILWGRVAAKNLLAYVPDVPVVGVVVGAAPIKRLDHYAPPNWRTECDLVVSPYDYHQPATRTNYLGVELDRIYEAKCLDFIHPDDLLWVVGLRATQA